MKYIVHSLSAFAFLSAALLGFSFLSSHAQAQQSGASSGVDLIELRNFAGAANVDGTGVRVLQVEAALNGNYSPDPNDSFLTTNNFNDIGNTQSTGVLNHARDVGRIFYGSRTSESAVNRFGIAPALGSTGNPPIDILGANEFLNDRLGSGNQTPEIQSQAVSNHSYVFNLSTDPNVPEAAKIASAEDRLRRLDYSINEGNTTTVVGTGLGVNDPLPAGLVQAYNTINVGLSDGQHTAGRTTLNGEDRLVIHVVADQGTSPSNATAVVSGGAAILHQTGAATDAVKQEVIKATILAGATKDDLSGPWTRTTDQPLDLVYGAGELNVLNNHLIQTGGEVSGGTSSATATSIGRNGWDYKEVILANDKRFYEFIVDSNETLEDLSIALAWNREVVDGLPGSNAFQATYNPLVDLSLELRDASGNLIDFSNSELDNVEHIFAPELSAGTYQIIVSNLSQNNPFNPFNTFNFSTDYGLAFRSTSISISQIPEPSSLAVLVFLAIGVSAQRRRQT